MSPRRTSRCATRRQTVRSSPPSVPVRRASAHMRATCDPPPPPSPPSAGSKSQADMTTEELIRLFSVLSHDLKSPIFSIDGFSELLLGDYSDKLDAEGQDFLRRIRSSAQQMRNVLDGMSHMIKLLARPTIKRPTPLS